MEITKINQKEYFASFCYLCNSEKLPFTDTLDILSPEMMQHVIDVHLPLRCDRCSKVFTTTEELGSVGKCCPPLIEKEEVQEVQPIVIIEEAMGDEKIDKTPNNENVKPLSQMNNGLRRKSKDFIRVEGQVVVKVDKQRQTSTPMPGKTLMTNNFTDSSTYSASSIHISSINCTSSTSSESDGFSPPIDAQRQPMAPPLSPQRSYKPPTQSRSRQKQSVKATPLRQVMSKSIQRAIQQHGHYRQSPFSLQQRKMSFNSTNSSGEHTFSLLKFQGDDALDLRTSPAIRRRKNVTGYDDAVVPEVEPDLIDLGTTVEFQQIEVIIRRSEIKSESSASSHYKSCFSDTGRSGSMPEIQCTPKTVGNNFLKKTISFETPKTIEKTPSFLMTALKQSCTEDADEDDDGAVVHDDDVFYTPRATPAKMTRIAISMPDVAIPIQGEEENPASGSDNSKSRNHIWNFVTSVMKIAARKSEESLGSADKLFNFNFKKPEFVKKAAEYFKRSQSLDDHPMKRRRTSSNTGSTGSQSSPAMKRQKIQSRKPIERMRTLT